MMTPANMQHRRRAFVVMVVALMLVAPTALARVAYGQAVASPSSAPVIAPAARATIARARSIADRGEGTAARAVLDTLIAASETGSAEFAEALYWRAVLADRASDAERDWLRLTVEASLSSRVPDALLWLGELELVRGHPSLARAHLQRLLLDHSEAPQRSKAMLWIVRSYFDERDDTNACASLATLRSSGVPDGEIRLQSDDMGRRCTAISAGASALAVPAIATAAAARTSSSTVKAAFSVQLAAYDTRAEATRMVKRMAARKVIARIDGTRKPFRVRTGRYDSEAAAKTALAALKKRGITGFVAETTP